MRIGVFSLFFVGMCLFATVGRSETPEFFSKRPVVLNIGTQQTAASFDRTLSVEKVKRAITRFMGDEKKAQIFLLQKFLTDAKSRVQMQIKVEEDVFEINNGDPSTNETLRWNIRLTSEPKLRALLQIIDEMNAEKVTSSKNTLFY